MDKVLIEGLEFEAKIGIHDWERRRRQPLRLDLALAFDNRRPAASDAIADTLDYQVVADRLLAFAADASFQLIEALAEECAQLLLREFAVDWVQLTLRKPGALHNARAAAVAIERTQADLRPVPASEAVQAQPLGTPTSSAAALRARIEQTRAQLAGLREAAPPVRRATSRAYISLGSNIEPEANLRAAVAALRKRFGEVVLSPVYRSPAAGFRGPDFLNAIALVDSDIHPFALNDWLHALEIAQGRDRRDAAYSNRPLDIDIIYFGELVLDGPGDFQLPRPELHHAFVLKPLADVAPDFVDPIRGMTLARLWAAHPQHDNPPEQVDVDL
jgi:2-amino-4-hydroxy-6-hydroxymethyldihydropteridine diphosphokinase